MRNEVPNKIYQLRDFFREIDIDNAFIREIKKGLNSEIYELEINSEKFILKFYPKKELIKRNRIQRELNFLNLLNTAGYKNVPRPIRYDFTKNWMLMTYLDGNTIKDVKEIHYKKLFEFILDIQKLKNHNLVNYIGDASEAKFNLFNHFYLVQERLNLIESNFDLLKISRQSMQDKINYLLQDLTKKMEYIRTYKLSNLSEYDLKNNINSNQKILSQSDIGFHNIFEDHNSNLLFFDFEYSGWDDSFKMLSDIIMHPDWGLKKDYFYLLDKLIKNYIFTKEDAYQLYLTSMIYRVKWACIILNPIFMVTLDSQLNNEKFLKIINKSISYLFSNISIEEDFYSYLYNNYL